MGWRGHSQVATANPTASLAGRKLYEGKKGVPPIFGGVKVGTRRIVVVTGASSGLGLYTAKALVERGNGAGDILESLRAGDCDAAGKIGELAAALASLTQPLRLRARHLATEAESPTP